MSKQTMCLAIVLLLIALSVFIAARICVESTPIPTETATVLDLQFTSTTTEWVETIYDNSHYFTALDKNDCYWKTNDNITWVLSRQLPHRAMYCSDKYASLGYYPNGDRIPDNIGAVTFEYVNWGE